MKKSDSLSLTRRWIRLLIALTAILVISLPAAAASELGVLVKLDPRLLGPTYGGPRWVSPTLYDVVSGGPTYTIEAKAQLRNNRGGTSVVRADWAPADPDLMTVAYRQDNTVALQINGQGRTTVEATMGGAHRTLYVTASYFSTTCTNLRVMISQTSQPKLPAQTCSVSVPMRMHLPMLIH